MGQTRGISGKHADHICLAIIIRITQLSLICVLLSVYLRAPADVCYERLKQRNRKEEAGVPFVRWLSYFCVKLGTQSEIIFGICMFFHGAVTTWDNQCLIGGLVQFTLFFQEFIEALHKLHEEWLMERKFPVTAPVLVSSY